MYDNHATFQDKNHVFNDQSRMRLCQQFALGFSQLCSFRHWWNLITGSAISIVQSTYGMPFFGFFWVQISSIFSSEIMKPLDIILRWPAWFLPSSSSPCMPGTGISSPTCRCRALSEPSSALKFGCAKNRFPDPNGLGRMLCLQKKSQNKTTFANHGCSIAEQVVPVVHDNRQGVFLGDTLMKLTLKCGKKGYRTDWVRDGSPAAPTNNADLSTSQYPQSLSTC